MFYSETKIEERGFYDMTMRKLHNAILSVKHIFIFVTFLCFTLVSGFAQDLMRRDIKIKITGEESKQNPVHLTLASSDTKIVGSFSVTTMNLIVSNESSRILEGELEFPLDEGESVIGYAIDVNGKLRQGVVVEKDKGRQVFEAVVRQGAVKQADFKESSFIQTMGRWSC